MPDYVIRAGDREAFIAALRQLADFLTANPGVLTPRHPYLGVFVDAEDSASREAGVELAATPLGAPVRCLGHGVYAASRAFGPIDYSVSGVPPRDEQ